MKSLLLAAISLALILAVPLTGQAVNGQLENNSDIQAVLSQMNLTISGLYDMKQQYEGYQERLSSFMSYCRNMANNDLKVDLAVECFTFVNSFNEDMKHLFSEYNTTFDEVLYYYEE